MLGVTLLKFKRSAFGYKSADVEDYIDELAERHDVELEHKDSEIRRLKPSLEQLQLRAGEFETASTRLRELETTNGELSARLADMEQSGSQIQSDFARLRSDLQAMDTLLREKDSAAQAYQAEVTGLRNRLADIPRLEAMLAERDKLLSQAEADAQASRKDLSSVEDLRISLADKERVIEELTARISTLEEALARQEDELALSQAAPAADAIAGALVPSIPGATLQSFESVDDISGYLSEVTLDLGQAAIQKNSPESRRFQSMALALRDHLSSLTSELGTYRQQEKAISQALIKAQLKAAEIETDALSETLRKKADLLDDLESGREELELTEKTTQKFKDDLATVLENYKDRLTSFGSAEEPVP